MPIRADLAIALVALDLFWTLPAVAADTAPEHFLQGMQLAQDGKVDEAIGELRAAAQLDSTSPDIPRELSRLLLQTHRPAESMIPARRAVALSPGDPLGRWLLGECLVQQSKLDEGIPELRKAVDLDRGARRDYLISLLLALNMAGKAQDALHLLRRETGGYEPDTPFLYFERGGFEEQLGQLSSALDDYLEAMHFAPGYPGTVDRILAVCRRAGPSDTTATACGRALDLAPDRTDLRRLLAQILINLGREQDALPHLEALHAKEPQDAAVTMQLGVVRFAQGDFPQAARLIRAARDADPTLTDVGDWLWRSLDSADSLDGALRVADDLVESSPEHQRARRFRAVSLARLRRFDDARADLDSILKRAPGDRDALLLSASILGEQGKLDEARARLRAILVSSPDDHNALYRMAQVEQQDGDTDSALVILGQLIQMDPKDAPALNDAGYLCAELGIDLQQALEWTSRAVALDENSAAYHDSRGWVLYRLGRFPEALEELRRAAAGDTKQAEIQIHLAQALRAVGRQEEGRRVLENLLARQPGEPRAVGLLRSWGISTHDHGGNSK